MTAKEKRNKSTSMSTSTPPADSTLIQIEHRVHVDELTLFVRLIRFSFISTGCRREMASASKDVWLEVSGRQGRWKSESSAEEKKNWQGKIVQLGTGWLMRGKEWKQERKKSKKTEKHQRNLAKHSRNSENLSCYSQLVSKPDGWIIAFKWLANEKIDQLE